MKMPLTPFRDLVCLFFWTNILLCYFQAPLNRIPGLGFTKLNFPTNFPPKFPSVSPNPKMISPQNFAHAPTALLLVLVQNFVVICCMIFKIWGMKIFIKCGVEVGNPWWNRILDNSPSVIRSCSICRGRDIYSLTLNVLRVAAGQYSHANRNRLTQVVS